MILQVTLQSHFKRAEEKLMQGEQMLQEHQNACQTIIVSVSFLMYDDNIKHSVCYTCVYLIFCMCVCSRTLL